MLQNERFWTWQRKTLTDNGQHKMGYFVQKKSKLQVAFDDF